MGNSQDTPKHNSASILYTLVGATLAVLGGGMLLLHRFTGLDLPDWLYYCAVGALVLGMVEWALGRMTPEAAWDWNKSLIFALSLATLIRWPIAEPYRIPSGSMETTLHGDPAFGKGDRVFVNKWIYGVRYPFMNKRIWQGKAPERWDIVVFKSVEPDAEHPTLVKRIVGMPGDHFQIRGGQVYVNNEVLPIPDFMPEGQFYTAGHGMAYGVLPDPEFSMIPEGHYLVLGDNSANSRDGRYFGWLPNEHIVGRVASIWWPPPRWRDFTGFSSTLWWNGTLLLLGLYIVTRLFIGRSWPVINEARNGVEHLFINFTAFGIRIPMTTGRFARWGQAAHGDRVLYRPVGEAAKEYDVLLGRVTGLAGQELRIEQSAVYIDGVLVKAAASEASATSTDDAPDPAANGHVKIPEGHVFILPDEFDGGTLVMEKLGTVPSTHILGRATCVWWPLKHVRKVK